jgi:Flp pilus assembly protein TadD
MASASAQPKGASQPAVRSLLRAESLEARGDKAGSRKALEEAVKVHPGLAGAHMQLPMLSDADGDHTSAAEHYRHVLKAVPNNVIALNNLAYHLAVRERSFPEALELARRAVSLAPQQPMIVDTLAWVEHLSGDSASAAKRYAPTGRCRAVTGSQVPEREPVAAHYRTCHSSNSGDQRRRKGVPRPAGGVWNSRSCRSAE